MPLLNYSTKVPTSRTISQIQATLVKHGAKALMLDFSEGEVSGISFVVDGPGGIDLAIKLPARVDRTLRVLQEQKVEPRFVRPEHVRRVAWRILKDWIEAQMALLETEMVRMEEIFLPYVISEDGRTLYQVMVDKRFLITGGG